METSLLAASNTGEAAQEVTGQVKWFDTTKGYGFITPANGMQGDILLHQTCVRQSGYKAAYEGAQVVCEAVQGPRGLQALRLLSLDNSTAAAPIATASKSARYLAEPKGPPFD